MDTESTTGPYEPPAVEDLPTDGPSSVSAGVIISPTN
jgi:hypothetical protein